MNLYPDAKVPYNIWAGICNVLEAEDPSAVLKQVLLLKAGQQGAGKSMNNFTDPKKSGQLVAALILWAIVVLVLLTVYGAWLRLFWYGWVMMSGGC